MKHSSMSVPANAQEPHSRPIDHPKWRETYAKALSGMDEAVCYLCLDGGADESGQPLRRDCACRGTDAGFVHLSCLTNYAAAKSEQARGMQEFRVPWRECPGCHQYYQNELGIE
jgi:hypothetical protein